MREDRNERFRRLAKARAEKIADELRKIGNLASPNYEYSEEEVEKMFAYLTARMDDSRSKFTKFSGKTVPAMEF